MRRSVEKGLEGEARRGAHMRVRRSQRLRFAPPIVAADVAKARSRNDECADLSQYPLADEPSSAKVVDDDERRVLT